MTTTILEITFWLLAIIVIYAYVGYGLILYLMVRIKRFFHSYNITDISNEEALPEVTFIVAAYNEAAWIEDKIKNSLEFNYPKEKIYYYFVTDGSSDNTPHLIRKYPIEENVKLRVFHRPERKGKIAAVERIMPEVKTPLVIYTDANTIVNKNAIRNIVRHYQDDKVGAVAGEKRIQLGEKNEASSAGEGTYWKYESQLKKWDSELYSVVGAAGELFSIRTKLYEAVEKDAIIEDFIMTLRIAQRGYRVRYEPNAYAVETSSASVKEELKRKIRIAAGGWQAIIRLLPLLNIFQYGLLSFQYISHRVLRWTIAPFSLPILLLINIILAINGSAFYQALLVLQLGFYTLALIGYIMEKRQLKFIAFFIPYYFCMMNYAVYRGFGRIITGKQSVLWEKAKRA